MKVPVGDSDTSLLSQTDFDKLSYLAFTELSALRHRGAFSAVAQAFTACCMRASALQRSDLLEDLFSVRMMVLGDRESELTGSRKRCNPSEQKAQQLLAGPLGFPHLWLEFYVLHHKVHYSLAPWTIC
jgi:hypothetical protein